MLEQSTNLLSGGWIPVASSAGDAGVLENGFEWVTNRINESYGASGFFRMRVGLEQ